MLRRMRMKSVYRVRFFRNIVFILLIALMCRLYYIQLVSGEELHAMAISQQSVSSMEEKPETVSV